MNLLESHHLSSNIYRCMPNKNLLQLRDECFIVQYQYFGLLIQRYGWLVLASLCGCHARVSDGSSDHVFVADFASRPLKTHISHSCQMHPSKLHGGSCCFPAAVEHSLFTIVKPCWTFIFAINYKPCWNTVCFQSSQDEAVMYQMEASKARPSCYVDDLSPRAQNLDLEQHNSIHWHGGFIARARNPCQF